MNRREFIQNLAIRTSAATALGIAVGCTAQEVAPVPSPQAIAQADDAAALPTLQWDMATSWPVSLDIIFGSAQYFADRVAALTGGRFTITPRAAGEIAPGLEVLNVVEQNAVQIGHTASYYYIGRSPVMAFGTALPFGLTAQQQNGWLYSGGLEMLQKIYAEQFGVIQFPAGNTGAQMGGWFRNEINSVADLQGLIMRIPGLGGQVMSRLGVTVQSLAAGEIFQALQTGTIDAAEWVGPYDDEKLGLNQVASHYYYPGWWEPGASLEVQINLGEWEKLPPFYQEAIKSAAAEANLIMLGRYDQGNAAALSRLVESGTILSAYSDEILNAAYEASFAIFDELAAGDADFSAVYEHWLAFRAEIHSWHDTNEGSFSRFLREKLAAT